MAVEMNKTLVIGIGLLVCFMLQCEEVHGKEYIVGDEKGWRADPNISHWTDGKKFKAGDVLVFRYTDPALLIANLRDKYFYETCDIYDGATELYDSGNDHVVLTAGTKYFAAAAVPFGVNYCKIGVKIKVDVE